ncbi:sensor histidine kinase [Salidesulfovibrio onnuriiensis]|uniref:sensor histidine kinase n=1 Tax=Salidesulfovibrio onnuriiensis TaxID=2583823 RepID=UPI0011C7C6D6|nr:sensor histidine kinase [Salidesulfovibrio onnuriiensis]
MQVSRCCSRMVCGLLLVLLWAAMALQAWGGETRRVLFVSSYSMRLSWGASVAEAVRDTLFEYDPSVELTMEFMDTKRYHSDFYYNNLKSFYKYKYGNTRFDVVITADDNAARFIAELRPEVFPGTPMVFCGVNDMDFAKKHDMTGMTGVFEEVDTLETIKVALDIMPETKMVYVVSDQTTTGEAIVQQVEQAWEANSFKSRYTLIQPDTMEALQAELARLPEDSIVLLLPYVVDSNGKTFTFHQAVDLIAPASPRPIFSFWDFYLNRGIVGGKLISGATQGGYAARMAIRILEGAPVSSVPIVYKSPNRFMFDYRQLKRFGISMDALPPGSIVTHMPDNIWARYWKAILVVSAVILALLAIIVVLSFNIAARHRAEKKLAALNANLEKLVKKRTEELVRTNIKLQRSDNVKTSLMNTVTHDLRTPLTSIIGFATMIRRDIDKYFGNTATDEKSARKLSRIRSNLEVIGEEGERMTRLISDFLDISKLEAGKAAWNVVEIDAVKLCTDAAKAVIGDFDAREGVTLETDIAGKLPRIMVDYDRMRQVLSNLLSNAAKFTEKGYVRLSAGLDEQGLILVSVADSGVGIPEDKLDEIFESFYQVESGDKARKVLGTGIGLSICRDIVEHFGGRIWAAPNPGGGTVVSFTLPPCK